MAPQTTSSPRYSNSFFVRVVELRRESLRRIDLATGSGETIKAALPLSLLVPEILPAHLLQLLAAPRPEPSAPERTLVRVVRGGATNLGGLFGPVPAINSLEGFPFAKRLRPVGSGLYSDL
jgi:hypothetical protein